MERRVHPIPFRTRQLSSLSPMILHIIMWESRSPPRIFAQAPSSFRAPGLFAFPAASLARSGRSACLAGEGAWQAARQVVGGLPAPSVHIAAHSGRRCAGEWPPRRALGQVRRPAGARLRDWGGEISLFSPRRRTGRAALVASQRKGTLRSASEASEFLRGSSLAPPCAGLLARPKGRCAAWLEEKKNLAWREGPRLSPPPDRRFIPRSKGGHYVAQSGHYVAQWWPLCSAPVATMWRTVATMWRTSGHWVAQYTALADLALEIWHLLPFPACIYAPCDVRRHIPVIEADRIVDVHPMPDAQYESDLLNFYSLILIEL